MKVFFAAIGLLCFEQVQAQTWQWLGPDSGEISHIYFKGDTVYAGGLEALYKSADSGSRWHKAPTNGTITTLNGLVVLNDNTLLGVGSYGVITQTADGGSHWNTQYVDIRDSIYNVRVHLNKVAFPSPNIGYIVGEWGTILKTTDGGKFWQSMIQARDISYSNLYFVDSLLGFVTARTLNPLRASLMKTSDGGISWHEVLVGESQDQAFLAVRFWDKSTGVVVGRKLNGELILQTENGGITWTHAEGNRPYELYAIDITGPSSAIAVGNGGTILSTQDKGKSWILRDANTKLYSLKDVKFTNSQVGYTAGFGGVLNSVDGGNTWSVVFQTTEQILSIGVASENTVYVSGVTDMVIKSTDGGTTWVHPLIGRPEGIRTMSFSPLDSKKGYLTSSKYGFYKTIDGGENWAKLGTQFQYPVRSLIASPLQSEVVFCIERLPAPGGFLDNVYRSVDSGLNWRFVGGGFPVSSHGSIVQIAFNLIDSLVMYAGVDDGLGGFYFYRSRDAGVTWNFRSYVAPPIKILGDPSDSNVVYFHFHSGITKSRDQGKTWSVLASPPGGLLDLYINPVNNQILFAATTSAVYQSLDGGQHWSIVNGSEALPLRIGMGGFLNFDASISNLLAYNTFQKKLYVATAKGVFTYDVATDVVSYPQPNIPKEFHLFQNYPNPFNPTTTIHFRLPKDGIVSLKVFDMLGREVATLLNDYRTAGSHQVSFNASSLTSGVYFYKLEANGKSVTRKMLLAK